MPQGHPFSLENKSRTISSNSYRSIPPFQRQQLLCRQLPLPNPQKFSLFPERHPYPSPFRFPSPNPIVHVTVSSYTSNTSDTKSHHVHAPSHYYYATYIDLATRPYLPVKAFLRIHRCTRKRARRAVPPGGEVGTAAVAERGADEAVGVVWYEDEVQGTGYEGVYREDGGEDEENDIEGGGHGCCVRELVTAEVIDKVRNVI